MSEFIDNILGLSFFEVWTDIHGGLAMLSLILFGAAIALYFSLDKFAKAYDWLKLTIYWLFGVVTTLNLVGLFVYRPYREAVADSPRTILKASEDTSWLHSIIFEHKEFLAFVPMLLLLVATVIMASEGKSIKKNPVLRRAIIFSVVTALVFVLVVATEAVLVTKTAPLG